MDPKLLVTIILYGPLVGAAVAGLFGRRIGNSASMAVTTGFLMLSAVLSWVVFSQWTWGGLEPFTETYAPFIQVGKMQVAVDVSSVVRASSESFRVGWTERRYQDGGLIETSRWSAILTTRLQPPRTPDAVRKNPLGLFINAINWSKELSQ